MVNNSTGLIFDLDGVLLDSESDLSWLYKALEKTLAHFGLESSNDNLDKIHPKNIYRIDETSKKPALRMRINNEHSSAIFLNDDELVSEYMKYYRLLNHFKPKLKRTVMFGGAGYAYPKNFLNKFQKARIDVVEIDPQLTKLARRYFKLKFNPRMTIYHEDARTFLNRTTNKYDAILIDVFKSNYTLPFHLTTKEAVQKNYDILNKDGVIILNLVVISRRLPLWQTLQLRIRQACRLTTLIEISTD